MKFDRPHTAGAVDQLLFARGASSAEFIAWYAFLHRDLDDLDAFERQLVEVRQRPIQVRRDDPGEPSIYFLREHGSAHVKIGRTEGSVARRIAELQTGNPRRLLLTTRLPVDWRQAPAMEAALHGYFAPWHRRGEWFEIDEDALRGELAIIHHIAGVRL